MGTDANSVLLIHSVTSFIATVFY